MESENYPTPLKRMRKCNFSTAELEILVDMVRENSKTLFSAFSSTINNKIKNKIWEEIADKISATTALKRTAADVRKKWNDYKCHIRKKSQDFRREARRTGGGDAPIPLSSLEEKVMVLIPPCQVDGIQGGLETGFAGEGSGSVVTENDIADGVSTAVLDMHPESAALPEGEDMRESDTVSASGSLYAASPTEPKRAKPIHAQSKTDHMDLMVQLEQTKLAKMTCFFETMTGCMKELKEVQERLLRVEERRLDLEERRFQFEKSKMQIADSPPFSLSPIIQF